MATITKPVALDETLQAVNGTLEEIRDAIGNGGGGGGTDVFGIADEVGINLWDEEWEVGGLSTVNGTNSMGENDRIRTKGYIPVFPNTNYCIHTLTAYPNNGCQIWFYDANKTGISRLSGVTANAYVFSTPANAQYVRFNFYAQYGATYKNDICINRSNSSINGTYRPFRGLRKQILEVSNETFATLVWTNPNISDNFPAQIVSLNLSGYRFFMVEFMANSYGSTYSNFCIGIIGRSAQIFNANNDTNDVIKRNITESSTTSLSFANCVAPSIPDTTQRNNYLVPYRIYGIK